MSSTVPSLSDSLFFLQQQLTRYIYSMFLVFGITGSCLNIVLLSRKQFRISSCCTYLVAVSTAILILLSWTIGLSLYALDHTDPVRTLPAFCKLRIYGLQSTALIYRWCLTAACFDRYALSAASVQLRNLAQIGIARRAVIVIAIVWTVLPMHSLVLYNSNGTTCGILYSAVGALYHSIFTAVAAGVLPVSIMTMCTVLTHHNLVDRQQRRQVIISQGRLPTNRRKRLQSKRDQQVLLMLFIQVLFYVITTIPLLCMYFYNALTINLTNKSADRLAIERFALFVAEAIVFLLPVCSFYLYTLASRMFRTQLVSVLRMVISCQLAENTGRVTPVPNHLQLGPAVQNASRAISMTTSSAALQKQTPRLPQVVR